MSIDVKLSPEETGYLLRLLKEHVEYFRALAGNVKCSHANREKHHLVEILWRKLSQD